MPAPEAQSAPCEYPEMPPAVVLDGLQDTDELDRHLDDFPSALLVGGQPRDCPLHGVWHRSEGERQYGAPLYYHSQAEQRVLCRLQAAKLFRWAFYAPGLDAAVFDHSAIPAALPQDARCWTRFAELEVTAALPMLRVAGAVLRTDAANTPLSEVGISAQSVVEVLFPAQETVGMQPAAEGSLVLYVTAPHLGHPDPVALEVDPGATVGGLVASFIARISAEGGTSAPAASPGAMFMCDWTTEQLVRWAGDVSENREWQKLFRSAHWDGVQLSQATDDDFRALGFRRISERRFWQRARDRAARAEAQSPAGEQGEELAL
eukprot:TRINITY_DN14839_c0_g4_i1.p1 TRINITY_DN14839_c0_g4~~TRINITY_DN14839_c0_g4_i1.p1  ORF type:complete len:354 (+),score=64.96 TRINITY_DN14839_c0_g4_i1:107-1063(+)